MMSLNNLLFGKAKGEDEAKPEDQPNHDVLILRWEGAVIAGRLVTFFCR